MTGPTAKPLPQVPLNISPPELNHLRFERKQGKGPEAGEFQVPLSTGLSVARFSEDEIGVELSVGIHDLPAFDIEASYRARFQIVSTEEFEDLETALKTVAARIAPAALYPFVRETLASTLQRAGISLPLLPVLNFGAMFEPATVELPPLSEDG
jgi:preprotein translocase subunit SecB